MAPRSPGVPHDLRLSANQVDEIRSLIKIGVLEAFAYQPDVNPESVISSVLSSVMLPLTVAAKRLRDAADYVENNDADHLESLTRANRRVGELISEAHADLLDTERAFNPHGYFVYVLWDADGAPLYVGQSRNVLSRLGSHFQEMAKRTHACRVTLTRHKSKTQMDKAEASLIARYQPPWNVAGIVSH